MLDGGFLFVDASNIRHAGAVVKQPGKLIELIGSANRVDLDATVVFVANPTAKTDEIGMLVNEPAESHSLHSA